MSPALLLLTVAAAAAPPAPRTPRPPENLLAGPARCVLRYLDAVRLAGPHLRGASGTAPDLRPYGAARRLTAPRTLAEIDRLAARGQGHPLAPWRDAARNRILESFQLLAARRAPLGAAVVTVRERYGHPPAALELSVSEYLVARVDGEWKVVDRRPGGTFDDPGVERGYAGFFDAPASSR
jgi:hypothetical protein